MPESVFVGQLHLHKACWELCLSDDHPYSDNNGQWQRALCMRAVLLSSQPNPQRNTKWEIYDIKQVKICAEYRDMVPRPRLDLSGTPGLRPIDRSPGFWQTSLGLGSRDLTLDDVLMRIQPVPLFDHWSNGSHYIIINITRSHLVYHWVE